MLLLKISYLTISYGSPHYPLIVCNLVMLPISFSISVLTEICGFLLLHGGTFVSSNTLMSQDPIQELVDSFVWIKQGICAFSRITIVLFINDLLAYYHRIFIIIIYHYKYKLFFLIKFDSKFSKCNQWKIRLVDY